MKSMISADGKAFDALGISAADEELSAELEYVEWPDDAVIPRPADWERRRRLIALARIADVRGRRANRTARNALKNGPLGNIAIEVLRHLATAVSDVTPVSAVTPASIARALGHSHDAVSRSLSALRSNYLLDWLPVR